MAATGPEPWSVPVGFTDSTLAAALLRMHEHEHALIAGPPRSGRSSALIAVAHAVLTGIDPPAVVAFAPRRSPLRELPAPVSVCTEYADLERILTAAGERVLLLVDDADTVTDTTQVLDRFIAKAGPGRTSSPPGATTASGASSASGRRRCASPAAACCWPRTTISTTTCSALRSRVSTA
ncbi:hypothetical protein ACFQ9X_11385 [Catenulispora yoronensis]